ncbi:uncharacterized protein [Nicotiana sylvestris]|uniref:uncharacterized protein n=1 Tax=Nicotiana sylvestris TaxID=4096 RepID=UPI00388CCEE5
MDMAYNMILDKPWIHEMDDVPSNLHQTKKKQLHNSVEGLTNQTSTGDGQTHVDSRPDTIQEPEENENIKTQLRNSKLWCYMTGIPPEVMTHKLNENPTYPPIKQKKRKQGSFKNQVIQDEVQKRLKIGSIREVKYPNWLANTAVVPKKNGKWRVCVDYTDLN